MTRMSPCWTTRRWFSFPVPLLIIVVAVQWKQHPLVVQATHSSNSRIQPPWELLASRLSSPARLTVLDDTVSTWTQECLSKFEAENFPLPPRPHLVNTSNYHLLQQPSGLCSSFVSCALDKCHWPPPADEEEASKRMRLPLAVVHPTSAADVVHAMKFAQEFRIPLSVKTSGHSFVGASTAKGSLLVHMGDYPKYAIHQTNSSLQECFAKEDELESSVGLANHNNNVNSNSTSARNVKGGYQESLVCQLALARGKRAVLRVGGGELWDEAYRAVKYWNEARLEEQADTPQQPWPIQENEETNSTANSRLYHIVGASSGTVAATGGWLSGGGLSGTTGMRMHGFGADQVLQIEMVLLNGMHVKFGPNAWDEPVINDEQVTENNDVEDGNLTTTEAEEEGRQQPHNSPPIYPQTTAVSGLCNVNSMNQNESLWQWQPCTFPNDASYIPQMNFSDLWYAVRGGGAGYGIILSVTYQLHTHPGKLQFLGQAQFTEEEAKSFHLTCVQNRNCPLVVQELRLLWIHFLLDYFFQPHVVNVTKEDSNKCGGGSGYVSLDLFAVFGSTLCYGGAGGTMAEAWRRRVWGHNQSLVEEYYLNEDHIRAVANSVKLVHETHDYAEAITASEVNGIHRDVPVGRLFDTTGPATVPPNFDNYWNAIIPTTILRDRREEIVPLLLALAEDGLGQSVSILGGNAAAADDGYAAIPQTQREGGFLIPSTRSYNLTESFQHVLYGEVSEEDDDNDTDKSPSFGNVFPGGTEYNHMGAREMGPLREDWTKPCPQWWSKEKRESQCFSVQEAVWGTRGLQRLEAIKKKMDPDHRWNCQGCVGYVPPQQEQDHKTEEMEKTLGGYMNAAGGRGGTGLHVGSFVIMTAVTLMAMVLT